MPRSPLFLALISAGCAVGPPVGGRLLLAERTLAPAAFPRALPRPSENVRPRLVADRAGLVGVARGFLGQSRVAVGERRYPDDCSGLVRAVYEQAGIDLMAAAAPEDNGVTAIYRFATERGRVFEGGRPLPGDIVFFRETYDANRDGRVNDGLTHVAIVEAVEPTGTVLVIHRVARGVVRYRMNLDRRDVRRDPASGSTLNDFLRLPGVAAARLTGQLFAGYATVLPAEQRLATVGLDPP